jgi:hypothetical protein
MAKTIEDFSVDAWRKSISDFSWLKEAVSGATDLDLFVERKGKFFVAEGKPWQRGVIMPYGQHRALFQLARLPQFRVYLVGESNNSIHVANVGTSPAPIVRRGRPTTAWWPPERFIKTSRDKFADTLRAWWNDA